MRFAFYQPESFAHVLADRLGFEENFNEWAVLAVEAGGVVLLLVVCWLAFVVTRRVLLRVVRKLIARTQNQLDDLLVHHKVLYRLSHVVPALLLYLGAESFGPLSTEVLQRIAQLYLVLAGVGVLTALLDVLADVAHRSEALADKPIRGYLQTVKILLFLVAIILILASLMDKSPWKLLSGIGAVSAVLLLVFKDSILGLVASIQISSYDMVKAGDWIEMPKFGADGDVLEVSLHTVKVQNWDKTVTTIPTQALVQDSFKNWRGMQETGGRRIKRALFLDMNTVRFCGEEMLDRFEKYDHLGEYVREKRAEVVAYNEEHHIDKSYLHNGRHLTNMGCFRAYVEAYLKNHPALRQDLTLLVRQLAPTDRGLPLEIYVFTADTRWGVYEGIQADIFDHLLAAVPEFDLRIFQSPSGRDFQALHPSTSSVYSE
jgi:miniconductance mechanosensitive channel